MHYRYGEAGQRTYMQVEGQAADRYVVDGAVMLAVVEGESLSYWNVVTPSGEVVGQHLAGGGRRYYLKDHLGSVRAVVDGSGAAVETRDYYPFGLRMPGRSVLSDGEPAREDFTGHERDAATGLHYAGARYYMAVFGRWTSMDPLADDYPAWSPYNYSLNNPTNFIDPNGRSVSSPIYDREGNLLGTDDEGLQGEAIVMEADDFEQGMSHEEALEKDLGKEGLRGSEAREKMERNYESLPSRPDYDGRLTFREAVAWYNHGEGKPLYVDAGTLNLTPFTVSDVESSEDGYIDTFRKSEWNTGAVYGTIKVTLINKKTGKVRLGGDGNNLDLYDFPPGSTFGKIAKAWPGSSESFRIFCYVCTNSVSPDR